MKLFCIIFMCILFLYEVHAEVDPECDSALEPEEYVDEDSEEYSTIESELEVLTKGKYTRPKIQHLEMKSRTRNSIE